MSSLHRLIDPAREHYDDRLAYHNWGHAQDVMSEVHELAKRVESRDNVKIQLDLGVLAVAAAWHDAGYIEDHITHGFETKEHYAAHLAAQFLREQGETEEFIDAVVVAILGTIHHSKRTDMNALALHRADIANIGGPYTNFYLKNTLLYKESILFGSQLTWPEWTHNGHLLIKGLIVEAREELPRLGEPIEGQTAFPQRAANNSLLLSKTPRPMKISQ